MTRGPKQFPFLNDPRVNQWLRQVSNEAAAGARAHGKPVWFAVPGLRGLVREDPDGRRWHVVRRKVVAELPPRGAMDPTPED
jgi:hypothetical protein